MKKSEFNVKEALEDVKDLFTECGTNEVVGGGEPTEGQILKITLSDGKIVVKKATFKPKGGNAVDYPAFANGKSVKKFCKPQRVLDRKGEDLTEDCEDCFQILANVLKSFVSEFDRNDEIDDFISFKCTKTWKEESFGKQVTAAEWTMQ